MKVIYDIFPARVRVIPKESLDKTKDESPFKDLTVLSRIDGSRMVDAVRVVITNDKVIIAADSSSGPIVIFRESYDSDSLDVVKRGTTTSRLLTDTGKAVIFEKDKNCGCGSRLRGWNPYNTLNASGDPTE